MNHVNRYDVVIIGGGMVGSMLAALLAQHSELKVAVLEQHSPEPFPVGSSPAYDIRVSALSIATQNMLKSVGAWQGIVDRRACVYRQMLVWDGEESGSTHFRADDIGKEALGHIVENRVLQLALLECLHQNDNRHAAGCLRASCIGGNSNNRQPTTGHHLAAIHAHGTAGVPASVWLTSVDGLVSQCG